jgi:hypothetical protein
MNASKPLNASATKGTGHVRGCGVVERANLLTRAQRRER